MRYMLFFLCILIASGTACGEMNETSFTLSEAIEFAIKNNPRIISSGIDAEIGSYGVSMAKAGKMPRINFNSGMTRYRYAAPITPISGSPAAGAGFPSFDRNIYDFGLSFILPLYRGGRLDTGVTIAEMKKNIADDMLRMERQDIIYNLTIVYFKIYQLQELLKASEASVSQLEAHKKNVEMFLKAGTVPRVELLKTHVELAHAKQNVLTIKNSLDSAYELLKTLMGISDINKKISVAAGENLIENRIASEEAFNKAFSQRPDYAAVLKKLRIAGENVRFSRGKRLPDVYVTGEYIDRSGDELKFKENWNLALRLSVPIFDGGLIRTEISKEKKEMEKARESERLLRLDIIRNIKDSYLNMENAEKKIEVSMKVIEEAEENLRIEVLRYETGTGTSTEVIDAQTALLRAETDYLQAAYEKNIAVASLRLATGEDIYEEAK